MTVVVTGRVPDELGAWLAEYAARRGVTKARVVEGALVHFRGLSEGGVPDLPVERRSGRPRVESSTALAGSPAVDYAALARRREELWAKARR